MAHIAIDARIIYTTTGRYIERLIHHLSKVDTKNHYTILLGPSDMGRFSLPNERFSKLAAPYEQFSLAEQVGFAWQLNKLKADLVHFTVPHRPVLYFGKQITTVHDLTLLQTYNSDKNWLVFHAKQLVGRFVFWMIARTSNRIITPTNWVKNDYKKFAKIPTDKITVTYEAADSDQTKEEAYAPLVNKQFLLCVGNQSDYKNIRRLMQAHQQLLKTHPDLMLACVGKITGKNGVTLARNKAWSEDQGFKNILYTDFISDEQLAWAYKNCRAYVFPSLMEGFGLPGLEAMTCGAPVASSDATCLPEVYGDAAHYFNPRSIDDMSRAIRDILTDDTLRQSLIKKGFVQQAKYSWKRMAEETLAVYERVLKSK